MSKSLNFALILIITIVTIGIVKSFLTFEPKIEEFSSQEKDITGFLIIQGNSLSASSPLPSQKVVRQIKMVVTAYSSTICQTDDTPFITASNTKVRKGIVANNFFPFGTRVRMPDLYGDRIFVVEDRMHRRKSNYHIDIWFPSYWEAKNFGAKTTYIEILES